MPSSGPRARGCGCCDGSVRVFVGPESDVRVRVCLTCDSPQAPAGFPQGFAPATWEINQRRRERGEFA